MRVTHCVQGPCISFAFILKSQRFSVTNTISYCLTVFLLELLFYVPRFVFFRFTFFLVREFRTFFFWFNSFHSFSASMVYASSYYGELNKSRPQQTYYVVIIYGGLHFMHWFIFHLHVFHRPRFLQNSTLMPKCM